MTCFAKLSVPVASLELPMDMLSSVGVLRSEQGFTPSKPAKQEEGDAPATGDNILQRAMLLDFSQQLCELAAPRLHIAFS